MKYGNLLKAELRWMVEKRKELLAKVHKGKMQQGGTRERCVRHPGHKI